jgi:nucleoside-diphosphate-sugar epimerase
VSRPTVLVTGCAGYIGSVLVGHLLKANYRVIGVDNLRYQNWPALFQYVGNPNFEFHLGSVTSVSGILKLAAKADAVIPLAALVGAPICDEHPEAAENINRDAIVLMVRGLSHNQTVIYPNTNSGYGQTDGTSFVTEDDPLTPISLYGRTKCDAEKAVLDHPHGTSLRLATVFGASPRMRTDLMVNSFTVALCNTKYVHDRGHQVDLFQIFEPHFKRNFVGVQDVARAFVHMLWRAEIGSPIAGPYNLGLPSANLTKLELAHKVCDTIGLSRELVTVGAGKDPDQRNYLVSNDKILKTGFKFTHTLEDGIREVEQVARMCPPDSLNTMRNS